MNNVLNPHKHINKSHIKLMALFCFGYTILNAQSVNAQNTVNSRALERSRFYTAPREFQIVDESPVIRDFREAPATGSQINLPNGPGGGPGAGGSAGIGGGSGANATIPAGGMPLSGGASGGNPAYRNAPVGMTSLPKSGFGGSNIPARGLGPRGILPGVTTGVVGKVMSQNKPAVVHTPARATAFRGPSTGVIKHVAPPSATSYGGYNSHPVSYGNNSRTETNVRGHLLRGK